jgi:hypothetical protein
MQPGNNNAFSTQPNTLGGAEATLPCTGSAAFTIPVTTIIIAANIVLICMPISGVFSCVLSITNET